uniref:ribonuclease H n=1 Tax=Gopherus agassizii TaxID=38772 RepID=A0A452HI29_9SAUR
MELDTGAAISLVSETVYKEKLQHLPLKATKTVLKTYTGEAVPMLGTIDVKVELNGQAAKLPLFVVRGNYPALMGRSWLGKIQLNWAEVHWMTKEETSLTPILRKHAAVFGDDLGSMKGITVTLNIKPDSPPKYLKARTVPYAIRPKVEADLERLVTNGVLIPVTHSSWATPIIPIVKKDGSLRICGDFKVTVNPVLCAEQYPLPRIDDLFAGLAGGQKFSKIDLSQAYLQMHVDEKSQELLTIVTHKGLYRYCRLPFGIMSAPALFQRAMDQILCGLSGVQCYLDDILVTGRNEEDHLKNLEATLQRLEEYGLRVRKDKCEFFKPSVEYLGHIIDSAGLHKAPAKVKAIVEAPPPRNVSQLRSFLGLLNYYGKFISQLATLLKPLHELLGQNKAWKWTEACDVAFNKAKDALLNSEVLMHFDPSLPLQLACDASPYGVGAVVSHIMPSGEEKPIAFASRTLSKAETNYAQIEREGLGIVFGIRK